MISVRASCSIEHVFKKIAFLQRKKFVRNCQIPSISPRLTVTIKAKIKPMLNFSFNRTLSHYDYLDPAYLYLKWLHSQQHSIRFSYVWVFLYLYSLQVCNFFLLNFLKLQVVFFGRKLNCLKLGSKNNLDLCGKNHHLHDINKNYMIRIFGTHKLQPEISSC